MTLYLFTTQQVIPNVPHAALALTELVLHKYLLGTQQLERLLLAAPNLEVLKLDYWVHCETSAEVKPHIEIPYLFQVLHPLHKTLRSLE